MMNDIDFSKEELLNELQELKKSYQNLNSKYEEQLDNHKIIEESFSKQNELLIKLNSLSLELAHLPYYEIFPFIVKKSKELFDIKGAFITSYDDQKCELVVEYSSLSSEENSLFTKMIGKSFIKYRTHVTKEDYSRIASERIKIYYSTHDLTFGTVPGIIGKTLENIFDVGWYIGISLMFLNKLVGTVILIGSKDKEPTNLEDVSIFSNIVSNAIGRMKAEGALRENDFFTSRVIDTVNEGFWYLNSEFKTLRVNQKLADMLGYSIDEILGKEVSDFMYEEDIEDRNIKKLERLSGKSSFHERRFRRKDGSELFTLVSSTPLFDNNGNFESSFGMISDITTNKKAEAELKNSLERNKALLSANPDLMFVFDSDFRVIDFHTISIENLIVDPKFFLGKSIDELLFAIESFQEFYDFKAIIFEVIKKIKNVLETGLSDDFSYEIPNGNKIEYFECRFVPYGSDCVLAIVRDISLQKQTQLDLQFSRESYLDILNSVSEAIYVLDENGTFIDVNKGAEIMYQYSKEELIGKNPISVAAEGYNDLDYIINELNKIFKYGGNTSFDFWAKRKNGEVFPKEVLVNKGKYFGKDVLIATARDITEKKRAELELQENISKTNAILKSIPDMLFILDKNGIYLDYHVKNTSELYVQPTTFIGKNFKEILPSQLSNEFENLFNTAYETKQMQVFEYSLEMQSRIEYFECRIIAYESNRILSIIRNITQRKSSETELIESERKFKLLNDLIAEMLNLPDLESIYEFIVDTLQTYLPSTIILFNSIDEEKNTAKLIYIKGIQNNILNKVFNVIGYSLIGKTFELKPGHLKYFAKGNLIEFGGGLVEFSANEIPVIVAKTIEKLINLNKIYTIGIKENNNLLASVHLFTFNNQEIKNSNFVETFVKQAAIVIQKQLAEDSLKSSKLELLELNETKDKFFSIIAHDLKSPFNDFLNLTKIMAEQIHDLTIKETQEFSVLLQENANNLYKLLENLLEWSRMQRGLINFNPEICNVFYLVKQNIIISQEFSNLKNIILKNSIPENASVFADIPMLNAIIRNLLSNAIKFTHKGGLIEIGLETKNIKKDHESCIYISDSGMGMSSDTISKLFKLDSKVTRPGTEGEASTGLGLILCKEFVEKHGGRIWVESEIDNGSTFYFTLPNDK